MLKEIEKQKNKLLGKNRTFDVTKIFPLGPIGAGHTEET